MGSLKKQHLLLVLLFSWVLISCNGQTKSVSQQTSTSVVNQIVGGGCDGCELMYVDMPAQLTAIDTSAGWNSGGQKLHVTGKISVWG